MFSNKNIFSIFCIIFILTGCYSFNTIGISNTVELQSLIPLKIESNNIDIEKKVCPVFELQALPLPPNLPIDELDKIKPKDKDSVIKLELEHITKLRKYILELRSFIRQQYNDYIKDCNAN